MEKHFCNGTRTEIVQMIKEGKRNIIPRCGEKQDTFDIIKPSKEMIAYVVGSGRYKPANIFAETCLQANDWARYSVLTTYTKTKRFSVYREWIPWKN